MNQEQIACVQSTWSLLAPNADQVAMLFYDRLIEIAPEWKKRLGEDLVAQGLEFLPRLATGVQTLQAGIPARGHKENDKLAAALLWTVEKGLGEDFTDEVKEAWSLACKALSLETLQAASVEAA